MPGRSPTSLRIPPSRFGRKALQPPLDNVPDLYTAADSSDDQNPHRLIDVPDVRQRDDYSCVPCSSISAAFYQHAGPGHELWDEHKHRWYSPDVQKRLTEVIEEWKHILGTNRKTSTHPYAVVGFLTSLGLEIEARDGLTLEDLHTYWQRGWPVICFIQEYGEATREKHPSVADEEVPGTDKRKAEFNYGHCVLFIGGPVVGQVFVQDPSIDNIMEGENAAAARGRMMIPVLQWLKDWHDQDVNGNQFVRYGIAVGPLREGSKNLPHTCVDNDCRRLTPRSGGNIEGVGHVTGWGRSPEYGTGEGLGGYQFDAPRERVKEITSCPVCGGAVKKLADGSGWRCEQPPCEWSLLQAGGDSDQERDGHQVVIHTQTPENTANSNPEWEAVSPDYSRKSNGKKWRTKDEPETPPPAKQPEAKPPQQAAPSPPPPPPEPPAPTPPVPPPEEPEAPDQAAPEGGPIQPADENDDVVDVVLDEDEPIQHTEGEARSEEGGVEIPMVPEQIRQKPQYQAFVSSIEENPQDPAHLLIFADWLEEDEGQTQVANNIREWEYDSTEAKQHVDWHTNLVEADANAPDDVYTNAYNQVVSRIDYAIPAGPQRALYLTDLVEITEREDYPTLSQRGESFGGGASVEDIVQTIFPQARAAVKLWALGLIDGQALISHARRIDHIWQDSFRTQLTGVLPGELSESAELQNRLNAYHYWLQMSYEYTDNSTRGDRIFDVTLSNIMSATPHNKGVFPLTAAVTLAEGIADARRSRQGKSLKSYFKAFTQKCPDGSHMSPNLRTCANNEGGEDSYPGIDEMHIEQDDRHIYGLRQGKKIRPSPFGLRKYLGPGLSSDFSFYQRAYDRWRIKPDVLGERRVRIGFDNQTPADQLAIQNDEEWRLHNQGNTEESQWLGDKSWKERCPDGRLMSPNTRTCQGRQADSWDGIVDKNNEPGWINYPDYADFTGLDTRPEDEKTKKPFIGPAAVAYARNHKKGLPSLHRKAVPPSPYTRTKAEEPPPTEQPKPPPTAPEPPPEPPETTETETPPAPAPAAPAPAAPPPPLPQPATPEEVKPPQESKQPTLFGRLPEEVVDAPRGSKTSQKTKYRQAINSWFNDYTHDLLRHINFKSPERQEEARELAKRVFEFGNILAGGIKNSGLRGEDFDTAFSDAQFIARDRLNKYIENRLQGRSWEDEYGKRTISDVLGGTAYFAILQAVENFKEQRKRTRGDVGEARPEGEERKVEEVAAPEEPKPAETSPEQNLTRVGEIARSLIGKATPGSKLDRFTRVLPVMVHAITNTDIPIPKTTTKSKLIRAVAQGLLNRGQYRHRLPEDVRQTLQDMNTNPRLVTDLSHLLAWLSLLSQGKEDEALSRMEKSPSLFGILPFLLNEAGLISTESKEQFPDLFNKALFDEKDFTPRCPDGSPMPLSTRTCAGREGWVPWTEEERLQNTLREPPRGPTPEHEWIHAKYPNNPRILPSPFGRKRYAPWHDDSTYASIEGSDLYKEGEKFGSGDPSVKAMSWLDSTRGGALVGARVPEKREEEKTILRPSPFGKKLPYGKKDEPEQTPPPAQPPQPEQPEQEPVATQPPSTPTVQQPAAQPAIPTTQGPSAQETAQEVAQEATPSQPAQTPEVSHPSDGGKSEKEKADLMLDDLEHIGRSPNLVDKFREWAPLVPQVHRWLAWMASSLDAPATVDNDALQVVSNMVHAGADNPELLDEIGPGLGREEIKKQAARQQQNSLPILIPVKDPKTFNKFVYNRSDPSKPLPPIKATMGKRPYPPEVGQYVFFQDKKGGLVQIGRVQEVTPGEGTWQVSIMPQNRTSLEKPEEEAYDLGFSQGSSVNPFYQAEHLRGTPLMQFFVAGVYDRQNKRPFGYGTLQTKRTPSMTVPKPLLGNKGFRLIMLGALTRKINQIHHDTRAFGDTRETLHHNMSSREYESLMGKLTTKLARAWSKVLKENPYAGMMEFQPIVSQVAKEEIERVIKEREGGKSFPHIAPSPFIYGRKGIVGPKLTGPIQDSLHRRMCFRDGKHTPCEEFGGQGEGWQEMRTREDLYDAVRRLVSKIKGGDPTGGDELVALLAEVPAEDLQQLKSDYNLYAPPEARPSLMGKLSEKLTTLGYTLAGQEGQGEQKAQPVPPARQVGAVLQESPPKRATNAPAPNQAVSSPLAPQLEAALTSQT